MEYLEELANKIRYKKEYIRNDIYRVYLKKNDIELLEKYLTELEQIKNSDPSEAMECIKRIWDDIDAYNDFRQDFKGLKIIENYILKAQEQEKKNVEVIGGRAFNKEILYLKQSIEQCNDKPIFYASKIYGNKYIVPQKQLDDLTNENVRYKRVLEIIKNKSVNMIRLEAVIMYNGKAADYNKDEEYQQRHLTDEEFDTLKEWQNENNK